MTRLFENGRNGFDGSPLNILVQDDRIAYAGPDKPNADEVFDLEGNFILPGFVDCHCHILSTGLDMQKLDLWDCDSRSAIRDAIVNWRDQEEWLLAVQYDANRFPDGRDISADELEEWTGGRPAILRHASGHSCVVNRSALRLAGITANTPNPSGGTIVRDESGRPTGLLLENAMDAVYSVVPPTPKERMADAIIEAARSMSAFGITCASDMMVGDRNLADEVWAYQTAVERRCPIRMRLYVHYSSAFDYNGNPIILPSDLAETPHLRVAGVKLFADGSIGSGTAALREPFCETNSSGSLIHPPDDLTRRVAIAERTGWQVAIHSIGDRSTDVVLECLRRCSVPSRHRIEHAMLLHDDQIETMRRLGVRVAMQPEFLLRFANTYRRRLGNLRAGRLNRYRSLLDAEIRLGFSSDRPIVPGNPWDGIRAANHRPAGLGETEHISVAEAIRLYTSGAADIGLDEDLGALLPGRWADFQVYATDPMTALAAPVSVFVGGESVLEE